MTPCFFVSDLQGNPQQYKRLFERITAERPTAVLLGGDLLPSFLHVMQETSEFVGDILEAGLLSIRSRLDSAYPRVFMILGNDDPRVFEDEFTRAREPVLWEYIHNQRVQLGEFEVYGYSYVPPTPFLNKDWERYDVSRFVDPGCVSPEEGFRTVPVDPDDIRHATIQEDLESLTRNHSLARSVFLFHTPPYQTKLDRAALDGKKVDHAPLDVHVGSIGVRRMIEKCQPLVTLHGHIHESAELTGSWRDQIGLTHMFGAAHNGSELALVRFALENPGDASRELIATES